LALECEPRGPSPPDISTGKGKERFGAAYPVPA
jgi:hypothetical protein